MRRPSHAVGAAPTTDVRLSSWEAAPPRPARPGSIARLAARRETARALLMVADAGAVAFALGIGVQFVAGAQLRPAALAAIPLAILVARVFGLYERPGRGLGRSTLTDVPRQAQVATLLALLASIFGDALVFVPWSSQATAVFWDFCWSACRSAGRSRAGSRRHWRPSAAS